MIHRKLRALAIGLLSLAGFLCLSQFAFSSPAALLHLDRALHRQAVYAQEGGSELFLPIARSNRAAAVETPETPAAKLLSLINQERTRAKCAPLRYNATLAAVAQAHSSYMAEIEGLQHRGVGGEYADSRLQEEGYIYGYWGESLAYSLASDSPDLQATSMMSRWLEIDEEYGPSAYLENIQTCEFRQIGIGSSARADGFVQYWDILFAGPQPGVSKFVTVDIQDRADMQRVYRDLYLPTLDVPVGWTGEHTTCDAGAVSSAYLEALRLQINFFRAMAGVPPGIVFKEEYNRRAQEAALMMTAAGELSHFPAETWECYSEAGYMGANRSNLSLSSWYGLTHFIAGFIEDYGPNNAPVGHRRWLLTPEIDVMGSGTVPPHPETEYAGNATYVVADELEKWSSSSSYHGRVLPATRDSFVAWPPPGYVPQELVYPRWSFSYPYPERTYEFSPDGTWKVSLNVSFAEASVTMLLDNVPVDVTIDYASPSDDTMYLPSLVWVADIDWMELASAQDHEVQVQIRNVRINGEREDFHYTVTIFDAAP